MLKYLPSKRALWVLAALLSGVFVANTVSFITHYDLSVWLWIILAEAVAVFIFDLFSTYSGKKAFPLVISRKTPGCFIVNKTSTVELSVRNKSKQPVYLSLFDHLPVTFNLLDIDNKPAMPMTIGLAANEVATIRYQVKPWKRGAATFAGVQIRLDSALRLWQKEVFLTQQQEDVKVYPDFRRIDQDDILSFYSKADGNISQQRQRGSGTDFAQLREYRIGDALSRIDPKASARFNKLISKQYQIERNQKVMILLDCSRRLRMFQAQLSHFDYALNTTVFLARSVLQQGDAVGMMSFGNNTPRYVAPKKGRHSISQILNSIYDLETSHNAPDYVEAARQFMTHQKRRCLVIMLTSLQDEDTESIKTLLRILQKRHLVLIANLKPSILSDPVDIRSLEDAIFYASRETYNRYRDQMLQHIGEQKLILLDSYPQLLTARLINLYLNIKSSGVF